LSAPVLKLVLVDGAANEAVKLVFIIMDGHMGVYIECQRGNGPMEFLAIDTEAPYLDDRPLLVAGRPRSAQVPPALL
jgi:hypothetical protein